MKTLFPIDTFAQIETPFYYYNLDLLRATLQSLNSWSRKFGYHVHYALKANANARVVSEICKAGLGIDAVSGHEVRFALDAGFPSRDIVFAGVGKADWEINLCLDNRIRCFNVESLPELEVVNALAAAKNIVANVALRINPNVDAHTHQFITTGLEENKFGIGLWEVESIVERVKSLPYINMVGLHFHIGSQITDMGAYQALCVRINELQRWFEDRHLSLKIINVGGGLGIDYEHPDLNPIPDFETYFGVFHRFLELKEGQELHFELGRSVVAQCGSLITRVLYVKEGLQKKFAIVDGGMNDLIRPALYHAYHKIENLSSDGEIEKYDVVGPVCESSDCFGKAMELHSAHRGDFIAIRSAGAYGEVMASNYNLRPLAQCYFSE